MKRLLISSFCSLLFTGVFGQSIIPRAGVTISNASFDPPPTLGDLTSVTGFTVGVGYELPLTGIIMLQPEINFIQKGYKTEFSETTSAYEQTNSHQIKLNYIEIPIQAKIKLGVKATKFYFSAGPSIGFALSGKYKNEGTVDYFDSTPTNNYENETDVKFEAVKPVVEDYGLYYIPHRIDVGVQFGAGVELFGKVIVDVRYGLGLTELYGDEEHLNVDVDNVKNRVLQLSVGVPLKLH